MATILLFILAVYIASAQNGLRPTEISGVPGACPSEEVRNMARQNLSQSVRVILGTRQNSTLTHPCGSGDWTRVAYLNMSDPLQQCPSTWRLYSANGVRACGRRPTSVLCDSHVYVAQSRYSKVCGKIVGYQVGSTDVFSDRQLPINQPYVDGVSLTYGYPRRHIWTFAAGLSERVVSNPSNHERYTCPCALVGTEFRMQQPPSFVGSNYFCESGNPATSFQNTNTFEYTMDPLWDGKSCEGQCCNITDSPPWFRVNLPYETSDNLEVRICGYDETNNEDTPIGIIDIYIQ